MTGRSPVALAVAVAAATLAVLSVSTALRGPFTNRRDRGDVLENPAVSSASRGDLGPVLSMGDERNDGGFRETPFAPLAELSAALDLAVWQGSSFGHHLTAAILFAATALLVGAFTTRWTGCLTAGGAAAGLFAVHPLTSGTASWIAGRSFVLSGALVAASLLVGRDPSGTRRGPLRAILSAAIFAFALLSDPRVAPLALVLALPAVRGAPGSAARGRGVFEAVLFLLPAAASVLSLVAGPPPAYPRFPAGVSASLGADLSAIGWAAQSFLVPVHLAPLADVPVGSAAAVYLAAGGALLALALAAIVRLSAARPPGPDASLALVAFAAAGLALAGQAGSVFPAESRADYGQAYLASLFLSIAVGTGFGRAWSRAAAGERKVSLGLAAAGLAALAGLSAWSNRRWTDPRALWESVLEVYGDHPIAHRSLGQVLVVEADTRAEGLEHLEAAAESSGRSLAVEPAVPALALGEYELHAGNVDVAEIWFHVAATKLAEAEEDGVYARSGPLGAYWRSAVEAAFGQAAWKRGDLGAAEARYDEALRAYPENVHALTGLARVQLSQGHVEQALDTLARAISGRPDAFEARILRAEILRATDRAAESEEECAFVAARVAVPALRVRALLGLAKAKEAQRSAEALSPEVRIVLEEAAAVEGVESGEDLSNVHLYLADYPIADRQWDAAIRELGLALEAWPANARAVEQLVNIHSQNAEHVYRQLIEDFRSEFDMRMRQGQGGAYPNDYDLLVLLAQGNPHLYERVLQSIDRWTRAHQALLDYPDPRVVSGLEKIVAGKLSELHEIRAGLLLRIAPERPEVAKDAHELGRRLDPANRFAICYLRDEQIILQDVTEGGKDKLHQIVANMVAAGDFDQAKAQYAEIFDALLDRPDHLKVLVLEYACKLVGEWRNDVRARAEGARREKDEAAFEKWSRMAEEFTQEGIRRFQQVLEIDPAHELARRNLAVTYSNMGQLDRAIHHYTHLWNSGKSTDDDRASFATLLLRRAMLKSEQPRDRRIDDLERYAELAAKPLASGKWLLLRLLAERSLEESNPAAAFRDLETLLTANPLDPEGNRLAARTWTWLAVVTDGLIRAAGPALWAPPGSIAAWPRNRVVEHLQRVISTSERRSADRLELARAYAAAGSYHEAHEQYRRFEDEVLALPEASRPVDALVEARTWMRDCEDRFSRLVEAGNEAKIALDFETARRRFREALAYNPTHEMALVGLAQACAGCSDPTGHELALRKLLQFHPEDPDGLYLSGVHAWYRLQDAGETRKHLGRYLELHPEGHHAERARQVLDSIPPTPPK